MNRIHRLLICFGFLVLGIILCVRVFLVQPPPGAPSHVLRQDSQSGTHFTVDIHELTGQLRDMPGREVREQLRDWALYGVLQYQGLQGESLVKATHKSYPVRLPELEEMFVFAHGPARRAILDDQMTVVFVYEKSERDPVAVLGRMADQVRMELGKTPSKFQLFAFEADVPRGILRVERMPDLKAEELYGPAYGYAEVIVSEPNGFKHWLESIDDVTYARYEDGTLLFGGRRFPNSRTRSVTLEDVATLYQAHDTIARERQALASKLRSGQHLEEYLAQGGRPPPTAPGFSLEPQYRQEELGASLTLLALDPCALLRGMVELGRRAASEPEDARTGAMWSALPLWKVTSETPAGKLSRLCSDLVQHHGGQLAAISQAVRGARDQKAINVALAPFWELLEKTKKSAVPADVLMHGLLNHVGAKNAVQCARYDGPLQGTRVGMNLFYTDLLAKLWLIDHHSAPSTSVSGFLSLPRLPASPLAKEEIAANPSTRLWFGPKHGSYSSSEGSRALFFRHVVTRVYAAGSNPLNPGKESTPAEVNRRVSGWWDRHYAEVADFEQEYHLQNEIMKWSILTGWLHAWSAPVQFLSKVYVNKDQTFDRWLEENREGLHYQHPIQLLPREQWIDGRECLEKLSSYPAQVSGYQVTGGVSLGGARSLESDLRPSKRLAPRRKRLGASLRFGRALEAPKLDGTEEFVPHTPPRVEPDGSVLAPATKAPQNHMDTAEPQRQHFELKYAASRPQETRLELSGGWDVGVFTLQTDSSGVCLRFEPGSKAALMTSQGGDELSFVSDSPVDADRGTEQAYHAVRDGGPRQLAALEALAQVHPDGWLGAVKAVRETALANGKHALRTGNPAEAVRIFDAVRQRLGDSSPEVLMHHALAKMQVGLSQSGLDDLATARVALRGKPDGKQVIEPLLPLVDNARLRDVKHVLQSDLGFDVDQPQGQPTDVQLEAHGTEVVSTLRINAPLGGRVLTRTERQEWLKNGNTVIYIDDRFSMNRVDFESAPAENLAELALNPYVSWRLVERMPTDSYSATRVVLELGSETESYTKVVDVREMLRDRVAAGVAVQTVFIRVCDANDDRRVSFEEAKRCLLPN